ncbi:hypothetical protein [Roseicella aquatilis]|uniref:Uncharacterized protein n=1 Tax=Roseicella aquatilis TaxID=2527868 RepID=A0A4R4DUJ3_9PROT|nr:hypothetical protein [Roseicella aquatilis]TCZ65555.1 hypothetical protein EXY23_05135 [Roseicella aquatilis]
MPQLGPYSRTDRLAKLDKRTKESRLLHEVRRDLTAHVGGEPTATQRMLIERAAQLSLQLALMERSAEGGALSERNGRQYLAWSGALTRTLRELGAAPAKPEKRRSLADLIARKGAEGGA